MKRPVTLIASVVLMTLPTWSLADTAAPAPSDAKEAKLVELGGRQGELRSLLDEMLKKSSKGEKSLGPEPDPRTKLPEESTVEKVEDEELDSQLLGEGSAAAPGADEMKPAEKSLALVGDRMARARQRLSVDHDPGTTTQIIQERILLDLDVLIEQANKQSKSASGKPGSGQQGKQPGAPKPGQGGQPGNADANGQGQQAGQSSGGGSSDGAKDSTLTAGGANDAKLSEEIKEKMSEWGGITPRQREAVIEGSSETVVEKYKKLVDDYYRSLATKSTERQ